MEVQTRSRCGQLEYFTTLKEAYEHAEQDRTVWKISFELPSGERMRLVKMSQDWVWQDMMREINKGLQVTTEPLDYGPLSEADFPLHVEGVFQYMDRFYIDGRGLVLTGILLDGSVSPGMKVVVNYHLNDHPFSQSVPIKGVERMGRSKNVGLLIGRVSVPVDGYTFKDATLTVESAFYIVS